MSPIVRSALLDRRAPQLRRIAGDLPLCHASVRAAFEARQFEIAYQPILRASDLAPVGCEALLRWQHPTRGPQRPTQFVPIMERSRLALEVGDWLLDTAARQILEWQREGLPALRLAVNVAPAQIHAADFAERTQRALDALELPAERLTLEVSQDTLLDQPYLTPSIFAQLTAMGVGIELDDFGGGPSAVSRLKSASLGGFKLDRRYLDALDPDAPTAAREEIRLLARLASDLGLRCTAEAVQTEAEFTALREVGISDVQGFLFCAALPPVAFASYLRACTDDVRARTTI